MYGNINDNDYQLQFEDNNTNLDVAELITHILRQLNPKQPITKLTPTIIHNITVKADGQLEVHYHTSKPSALYVLNNIKLDVPKTLSNKAYVESMLKIIQLTSTMPRLHNAWNAGTYPLAGFPVCDSRHPLKSEDRVLVWLGYRIRRPLVLVVALE